MISIEEVSLLSSRYSTVNHQFTIIHPNRVIYYYGVFYSFSCHQQYSPEVTHYSYSPVEPVSEPVPASQQTNCQASNTRLLRLRLSHKCRTDMSIKGVLHSAGGESLQVYCNGLRKDDSHPSTVRCCNRAIIDEMR